MRNPCSQLDNFKAGLTAAVLDNDVDSKIIRKAGIMGIVVATGEVSAEGAVRITFAAQPSRKLERV